MTARAAALDLRETAVVLQGTESDVRAEGAAEATIIEQRDGHLLVEVATDVGHLRVTSEFGPPAGAPYSTAQTCLCTGPMSR